MGRDWVFWVAIPTLIVAALVVLWLHAKAAPLAEVRITQLEALQVSELDLFKQRVAVLLTVSEKSSPAPLSEPQTENSE